MQISSINIKTCDTFMRLPGNGKKRILKNLLKNRHSCVRSKITLWMMQTEDHACLIQCVYKSKHRSFLLLITHIQGLYENKFWPFYLFLTHGLSFDLFIPFIWRSLCRFSLPPFFSSSDTNVYLKKSFLKLKIANVAFLWFFKRRT